MLFYALLHWAEIAVDSDSAEYSSDGTGVPVDRLLP